ncbi:hypothetical protein FRB99_007933, partial [Tulasnella sp. 403]
MLGTACFGPSPAGMVGVHHHSLPTTASSSTSATMEQLEKVPREWLGMFGEGDLARSNNRAAELFLACLIVGQQG